MIGEAAAGRRVCIGTFILNVNGFLFDCIGEFNFGGWFSGARAEHRQPDNLFPPKILRSQKDGKAGKNLKVTGVVHVLLVQVRGNFLKRN